MTSPEELGEWLAEEMSIERPTASDATTPEGELSALAAELHLEREMGDLEHSEQILHEWGMWVLSRTLLVTCSREPTEQEVRRALAEVIKWNPALRVTINKPEDASKRWELMKQPNAKPRLVVVPDAKSWREVAEEQLLLPIKDLEAPQFRCHYLSKVKGEDGKVQKGQCAFVFTLNHALIDGTSAVGLLKKFHSLLNSIIKSKPYIVIPWTRMFPPVEEYCSRAYEALESEEEGAATRAMLQNLPKFDLQGFFSIKNRFTEACGTESKKKPDIASKTCVLTREMSAEQQEKLRMECRKHGATVQGAAQIAGAIALASLMPSGGEGEKNETEVTYNLAYNLRPLVATDVPMDYAGIYIALSLMNTVTVGAPAREDVAEFWRLAAESSSKIKDDIKHKHILSTWYTTKGLPETMKKMKLEDLKLEGESRIEMLYTTTCGVWDFPADPDDVIKVEGVFSFSSVHKAGPIVNQELVTVNNRLFWSVAYSQRVISRTTAEKYADTLLEVLNKAVEPQEVPLDQVAAKQ